MEAAISVPSLPRAPPRTPPARFPSRSPAIPGEGAPALPLAYNLRQCSQERRRLGPEPRERRAARTACQPVTQTDLLGGNGRWRQRRAKEQWALERAEAERQRREREGLEAERKRRAEEREAVRRKQQEEDQQRQRASEEKRRRERLAQEERDRREEEERRLKEQLEHAEWLARQPKTCTTCTGSGKCLNCGGKGSYFTMFLAPSVSLDAMMDFGRAEQGCPECGGCAQNIRGAMVQGSGKCLNCEGVGMVTPVVEGDRRSLTRTNTHTSMRKTHTSLDLHMYSLRSPVAAESGRRSCLSQAEASRKSLFSQ
ncbi:unnamed protein product [Prorocentrum cordatum]|uniref:Uncharacterized protein n=1 Tax=Prorocentrum cordatum TaxID=2364126 RepID=A0ABN9RLG3_9DINO|nr:unnamed protein product [Polarella glacialis]